uniref:Uncharacterized protein n=1 Tax=Clastoptera arizonana TaxID=38151 RepID=A0A1B6CWK4_9HEMI
MDTFVTTYGKDYRWPYVRSMSVRAEAPCLTTHPHSVRQQLTVPGCECASISQPPKVLGPDTFAKNWCKPGPSPPLLLPVVYYSEDSPVRCDTVKLDESNAYLKQVK